MNSIRAGSRRLDNAHRIALETEDVGADILRNLRGQRETIENTRDTVSGGWNPVQMTHGKSVMIGLRLWDLELMEYHLVTFNPYIVEQSGFVD